MSSKSTKKVLAKEKAIMKKVNRAVNTANNAAQMAAQKKGSVNKRRRKRNRNRGGGSRGGDIRGFPTGTGQRGGFDNNTYIARKMEFIQNIDSTSTNFTSNQYLVNPGQANLFPWLSKMAQRFEKYTFQKLRFIYKPMVSQYDDSGKRGKIIMSFLYDAALPPPSNKQGMEDVYPHTDCMPYQERSIVMSPRQLHKENNSKFIRLGPVPPNASILDYDCGYLAVATDGVAVGNGVGELWVDYVCELSCPLTSEDLGISPINTRVTVINNDALPIGGRGANFAIPITLSNNGLGLTFVSGTGNTKLNLPVGNYLVNVQVEYVSTDSTLSVLKTQMLRNDDDWGPQVIRQYTTNAVVQDTLSYSQWVTSDNGGATLAFTYWVDSLTNDATYQFRCMIQSV